MPYRPISKKLAISFISETKLSTSKGLGLLISFPSLFPNFIKLSKSCIIILQFFIRLPTILLTVEEAFLTLFFISRPDYFSDSLIP